MDIHNNWPAIKSLFHQTFKSSFHYSIATVDEQGNPHITPIGSLILGEPGHAIYFEKYASQLPRNLRHNNQVCVMAVNSGWWFWLKSLFDGRFKTPPAVRLYGQTGELREATDTEVKLWLKRVKPASASRGHALMWRDMTQVRDIEFTHAEAVQLGQMTRGNWQR